MKNLPMRFAGLRAITEIDAGRTANDEAVYLGKTIEFQAAADVKHETITISKGMRRFPRQNVPLTSGVILDPPDGIDLLGLSANAGSFGFGGSRFSVIQKADERLIAGLPLF